MTGKLEIVANAINAASVVIAGRNSVHTWWTGIIGCVLFGWMFIDTQLYAEPRARRADNCRCRPM